MKLPADDLESIAASTCVPWRELDGARIFLTGGTGFWGRWLIESFLCARGLLGLNAQMTVLSRNPDAFLQANAHLQACKYLQWHAGDVRDLSFPDARFSHVLHCATPADETFNNAQPRAMFETIVGGTQRVLELAQSCGAERFLLASSGAVYGAQPSEITHIDEEFGGAPRFDNFKAAYAQGKRAAEWLAASYGDDFNVAIARGWAFVGPLLPLEKHFAIGNFLRDVLAERDICLSGDGTPFRSYLYASDMTIWLWTMLLRGQNRRAYNLGSEDGRPLLEIAQTVARVDGNQRQVFAQPIVNVGAPLSRYVPSVQRAKDELGLCQSVELEDAIARTLAWQRASTCTRNS